MEPPATNRHPVTATEVRRQIRESLGLPRLPENKPTVPIEGHVWGFLHNPSNWCISRTRRGQKVPRPGLIPG